MVPPALGHGPTVLATDAASAGASEPIAAGARAGDYVVERPLGAGGMGEVYAGRHPVIGKRVAIKVLRREVAARPDAADRFLREARAVNQIDHPNVVDVFAVGRLDDGRLYLVMDLLDGGSLREQLADGPMPVTRALAVLRQVADALDAAHARGVIHRDLKPDNIVLTGPRDTPTAHVLDFGIAKLVADAAGEAVVTLTGHGAWMGTPAYMAPEQWTADGATAASDRYSLGVMAFELLTGKPPFHAPSLPAMMEQHFRAAVPSVSTAAGVALSPRLDAVFARALAKDPAARPATAAALVDEVAAALDGRIGIAGGRRGRLWMGAAGLAVVAAAVGVVVSSGRSRRTTPSASPRRVDPAAPIVTVVTNPPGAEVRRGGARLGETPLPIPAGDGAAFEIELAKPGYVTVARTVAPGADDRELRVDLARASGFAGVWRMPEGELRSFERSGEQVAGFRLRSPTERREFLRFFTFTAAPLGAVVFTASEPFVAEEAPDEPSCNIALGAEYQYRPSGDQLSLRRERARYDVVDGRCRLTATAWSDWRPLERVAATTTDAGWVESRAGGAPPAVVAKPARPRRPPTAKLGNDTVPDAVSPSGQPPPVDRDNVQGDGAANQATSPAPGPQAKAPPAPQAKALPPPPVQTANPPPTQAQAPSPTQPTPQVQKPSPTQPPRQPAQNSPAAQFKK